MRPAQDMHFLVTAVAACDAAAVTGTSPGTCAKANPRLPTLPTPLGFDLSSRRRKRRKPSPSQPRLEPACGRVPPIRRARDRSARAELRLGDEGALLLLFRRPFGLRRPCGAGRVAAGREGLGRRRLAVREKRLQRCDRRGGLRRAAGLVRALADTIATPLEPAPSPADGAHGSLGQPELPGGVPSRHARPPPRR